MSAPRRNEVIPFGMQLPNPAGVKIRSTQGDASGAAPETGQSPVGAAPTLLPRRNEVVTVGSREHVIALGLAYVEARLARLNRKAQSVAEQKERRLQSQSDGASP